MAKIAIVGVGGIGGVVASMLQSAGSHELVLCVRSPLKELVVETPTGDVTIRATVVTSPDEVPAVDWVVVATKAYDVAGAALWLEKLCANGAPVAVFQNGVEHRERFAPYLPMQQILPVIVDCPVEKRSRERIVQRGGMTIKVPAGPLGESFVALFAVTTAEATAVADFTTVAWRKLCHNSPGAIPTILLQPGGVMRDPALGEVLLQMVRETVAVGNAEGANLDDSVPEAILAAYHAAPDDSINSLHADRLAGRPMEIDARNGVVVRFGKRYGIATPANAMAVALLEAMVR